MRYLLILLIAFTSCVSLKPGKNIDKAEDRIIKLNKGIQNQIERFPSLVDKTYTTTKYDTITIPRDTVVLEVELFDVEVLDSLEKEYYFSQLELKAASSSLEDLKTKYSSNSVLVSKLQRTQLLLNNYKIKSDSIFSLYKKASRNSNLLGTYEDDKFKINYTVSNGKINLRVNTKPKYKVVKVSETTNEVNIKKHFYEDYKFYLVLLGILILIYFIGDILKEILNKVIENIVKIIRKLIFKI